MALTKNAIKSIFDIGLVVVQANNYCNANAFYILRLGLEDDFSFDLICHFEPRVTQADVSYQHNRKVDTRCFVKLADAL